MKKLSFILFLLTAFNATAQKDSLDKYTVKQLVDKTEQAYANLNPRIKIYSDEIISRNPHDSIKAFAYCYIGNIYYGAIAIDFDKAIENLKTSLMYAKRCNNSYYIIENFNIMAVLYVMMNKNEQSLECIEQIKYYALR